MTALLEAELLVQRHARLVRQGDAADDRVYRALAKLVEERRVEAAAVAVPARRGLEVDRALDRMAIRASPVKLAGVAVADHAPALFENEIRQQCLLDRAHARGDVVGAHLLLLERDDRAGDVRVVDACDRGGITARGWMNHRDPLGCRFGL